jgi:hypothetical protein
LATIWQHADPIGRDEIRRLFARANDRLAIDPYSQGESRGERDIRILFELPLAIRYRIERFQGAVLVLRAQLVGKRPRK